MTPIIKLAKRNNARFSKEAGVVAWQVIYGMGTGCVVPPA